MRLSVILPLLMAAAVAPASAQSGHVAVNGTRIYREVEGAGAPVVLIHGNFGDRRHWDAQFSALAREFRVLRYDLRGFGRSAMPVEGEKYAHYDDLAALLRDAGMQDAHVVAVSMGSSIAADFVLAYPQMVRSLTVVGPWIGGYSSSSDHVRSMYDAFNATDSAFEAGGASAALQAWNATPYWLSSTPDPAVRARLRDIAIGYSFWNLAHTDPATPLQPRAATRIARITAPTLIVTGSPALDREVAEFMERGIAGARKVVIDGAGHMVQMERPVEFTSLAADFIRGVESQRGASR